MPELGTQRKVAFIGLPEAGKTTYIVALYGACHARRDGMAITHLGGGHRDYLNNLRKQLADFKSLSRTQQDEPGELDLQVRLTADGPSVDLLIPDLSGEHLRDALGGEQPLDASLHDLLTEVDAALLFVRVDKVEAPQTLVDYREATAGLFGSDGDTAPDRPEDWEVACAATQVRLTHAIQEVLHLRGASPLRLAVVLSAWDFDPDDETQTPGEWADEHLALLVQMLSHDPRVEWKVFGASSQGGDFQDPKQLERLESVTLNERARMVDDDGIPGSVAAPIAWVLNLSQ